MTTLPENTVWVILEQQEGKLADGSLELVGEGTRLADKLKTESVAVVFGAIPEDQATLIAHHGAKKILVIDHPSLRSTGAELATYMLVAAVRQFAPEIVLALDSANSADIACRVATVLDTGVITACDRVDINTEKRLGGTRPIYGNKAAAQCVMPAGKPQMATVNPDALELKTPNPKNTAVVTTFTPGGDLPQPAVRFVEFIKGDPKSIPLTEAEIVVAAGMGIGARENLRMVEELADAIGGSVGATRRIIDEGWLPLARQIGLTGKTVRPRLYIACGVSGAIQHTLGMKDSRAIIAINTDRNAPIFQIADVGVLGDVLKVLPVLTTHLKKVLAQNPKAIIGDVLNAASNLKAQ